MNMDQEKGSDYEKNKMDVYIGFHNERLIVMYATIHARSFFKQNFNIIAL